jgi:phosphoglycolate phosphatase
MKPALVLFDLDGTLVDSRPGIVHSLRETLALHTVALEADHDFTWCIGASLWKIFEHYLNTTDQHVLSGAVAQYRHIYRDGPMFEYDIYDGVIDTLAAIKADGARICIATAKAHEYAREIIEVSKLEPYIDHVYGSELDGRNVDKRDLLRHVLAGERIAPELSVMIGDRNHDIDGALANGVHAVGVRYGYGSADEIQHAHVCVDTAAELPRAVASIVSQSR